MILVTVGTTDFDELVERMDELAPSLGEEVVAQIGRGSSTPRNMTWFRFAPTLEPYFDRARLVIAHGGVGTTLEVLRRGIKLIALSNEDRFDRHQDDLLRALESRGHLMWCPDVDALAAAIARVDAHRFTPYVPPPCDIAAVIRREMGLPPNS